MHGVSNSAKEDIFTFHFCHKFWNYNPYIFAIWWCKPLIFQTIILWNSLKYLRSPTLNCIGIGTRKSEFSAKTQFLSLRKRYRKIVYTSINFYQIDKNLGNAIPPSRRLSAIPFSEKSYLWQFPPSLFPQHPLSP